MNKRFPTEPPASHTAQLPRDISPQPDNGQTQAVTRLAAKVAHELNNPLDAVLRFVSLAQRKAKMGDYADLDRYLADAQFGLERMAEVLRELMEVGRETNDALPRGKSLPLGAILNRATRALSAQAQEKQICLVIENSVPNAASENEPHFDSRLLQAVSNLLKNAIEAAPPASTVRLNAQLDSHHLTLSVYDEGQGIPAEIMPHLFTPFVTTKPKGAGNGLGLAISREMVSSLGGTLQINNRLPPQTGCVATITLPV